MTSQQFRENAITLIDDLKAVCASYGLGNECAELPHVPILRKPEASPPVAGG
ncbi:MAG: hypothetical protein IAE94_08440 [Chthoniobacterales bacterium]|nr:hypothetical protein [Chthoniobacterales bacterium]